LTLSRSQFRYRDLARPLVVAVLGCMPVPASSDAAPSPDAPSPDAAPQTTVAPEFSADIVRRDAGGSATETAGRLYVAAGKVRIESAEAPAGFFLVDSAGEAAWFVRVAQRVFTEAGRSTRLTQIFVPLDPKNPCTRWQQAAQLAGTLGPAAVDWHCQREHARAGAAATLTYRVALSERASSERWIDPALGIAVKERSQDGATITLENIRIGPQAPSLFVLPPGYHRLDPQTLIDRIRHSDVWAAPEH